MFATIKKKLMLWVLPGVFDVRASFFRFSKEFRRLDFPTFERPKKEISGEPPSTQWAASNALFINSDEVIFIALPEKQLFFKKNHSTK